MNLNYSITAPTPSTIVSVAMPSLLTTTLPSVVRLGGAISDALSNSTNNLLIPALLASMRDPTSGPPRLPSLCLLVQLENFFLLGPLTSKIFAFISAVIIFLIVCINALVLMVLLPNLKHRSQQELYITNLAICDVFTGAMLFPAWSYEIIRGGCWDLGDELCVARKLGAWIVGFESGITVGMIAYDRLLMIYNGATYNQRQTYHRVLTKILFSWLLSCAIFAPVNIPQVIDVIVHLTNYHEKAQMFIHGCFSASNRIDEIYKGVYYIYTYVPIVFCCGTYLVILIKLHHRRNEDIRRRSSVPAIALSEASVASSSTSHLSQRFGNGGNHHHHQHRPNTVTTASGASASPIRRTTLPNGHVSPSISINGGGGGGGGGRDTVIVTCSTPTTPTNEQHTVSGGEEARGTISPATTIGVPTERQALLSAGSPRTTMRQRRSSADEALSVSMATAASSAPTTYHLDNSIMSGVPSSIGGGTFVTAPSEAALTMGRRSHSPMMRGGAHHQHGGSHHGRGGSVAGPYGGTAPTTATTVRRQSLAVMAPMMMHHHSNHSNISNYVTSNNTTTTSSSIQRMRRGTSGSAASDSLDNSYTMSRGDDMSITDSIAMTPVMTSRGPSHHHHQHSSSRNNSHFANGNAIRDMLMQQQTAAQANAALTRRERRRQRAHDPLRRRYRRAWHTMIAINLVFTLWWLPHLIVNCVSYFTAHSSSIVLRRTVMYANFGFEFFFYLNSLLNPVIYLITVPSIKLAISSFIWRRLCFGPCKSLCRGWLTGRNGPNGGRNGSDSPVRSRNNQFTRQTASVMAVEGPSTATVGNGRVHHHAPVEQPQHFVSSDPPSGCSSNWRDASGAELEDNEDVEASHHHDSGETETSNGGRDVLQEQRTRLLSNKIHSNTIETVVDR